MREIKFRAWVPTEKTLCEVLIINHKEKTAQLPIETAVGSSYWWDETVWSFEEVVLMQYIGLKDKYGMDIYEGDIIDCEIYGQKHRGVVQYANMLAVYYLTGLSRSDTELWLASKKQIIGNKYEHPHLLESEDDL